MGSYEIAGTMNTLQCFENLDFVDAKDFMEIESHVDTVIVSDNRVLENMLKAEKEVTVEDYCSNKDSKLAPHMRKIVTDWMMEVCEDQQCKPEVFFLSINYLDRFLSSVNIKKNQFQLCASVCILLASKFSQVVPITTDKLVIYTDSSVTVEELRQWEIKILNVLQWELCSVTTHTFLEHFIPGLCTVLSKVNNNKVRTHAHTIAAMAATEYDLITAKQSIVAAAALSIAVKEEVEDESLIAKINHYLARRIKCSENLVHISTSLIESMLARHAYLPSTPPPLSTATKTQDFSEDSKSRSKTPTYCQDIADIVFT